MKVLNFNFKSTLILASLAIIFFSSLILSKKEKSEVQDNNLSISASTVPVTKVNFKLLKRGLLKSEVEKIKNHNKSKKISYLFT